jgi:predicted amidohydrolase
MRNIIILPVYITALFCAVISGQTIKIACAQVSLSSDYEANAIKILAGINRAADSSADLVIFPEGMLTNYIDGARAKSKAWIDAKLALFGQECAKRGIGACVGSSRWEGSLTYNSLFLIGKDGQIIGTYDKTGVYSAELAAGFSKGMGYPVYEFDHNGNKIRIGMQICLDQRYFAGFRILAKKGAQIILHQAAAHGAGDWTHKRAAIKAQLRSRAVSNSVILASVNVAGNQMVRSHLFDPRGRILNATVDGNENMICAVFDLSSADRANFLNARHDLYEVREK